MKLVPILEAGYAKTTGGLSDKEMIRKFFVNDPDLAEDIGEVGGVRVIKAFFPKSGLMAYSQYSGNHITYILLLNDGTWQLEDEKDAYDVKSLEGIQLHQTVYAQ